LGNPVQSPRPFSGVAEARIDRKFLPALDTQPLVILAAPIVAIFAIYVGLNRKSFS
jgi:hypothetical protein